MAVRRSRRVQKVILPLLRGANLTVEDLDGVEHPVTVNTWVPNIERRQFPLIQIRRVGGSRFVKAPNQLYLPVIEMTVYTAAPDGGLDETEDLYEDALDVLYDAVKRQRLTEFGYLHSIKETMGGTQFSSPFQDSWRFQGLIQLGVRPPR